jgi:hypothetical protein
MLFISYVINEIKMKEYQEPTLPKLRIPSACFGEEIFILYSS